MLSTCAKSTLQGKHRAAFVKELEVPAAQAEQLEAAPLDVTTNPEGHAHIGPIDTAPVMPQGRHSYEVVSKYALPHVPLAINQYLACALTKPNRWMTQMQTAKAARMDQDIGVVFQISAVFAQRQDVTS